MLKKTDLLPTDPIHRVGGVGGGRGVCGQNICYHVAAFVILFNFDMQHDHVLKKLTFDLLTPSPGSGRGGRHLRANVCYIAAAFSDFL